MNGCLNGPRKRGLLIFRFLRIICEISNRRFLVLFCKIKSLTLEIVYEIKDLQIFKRKSRRRPARQGPSVGASKKRDRPPGSKNKKPAKGRAAKKAPTSKAQKKTKSEPDSEDGSSEGSDGGGGGGGGGVLLSDTSDGESSVVSSNSDDAVLWIE
jgi:hypothetical protein